ncbi:phytoene desaturase family protein [Marinoscillum furvescens]|uniref:Phytoene desaturase n=1 Tax=Marinoscillum furvescens DSM 4134 TaxID=1122208 RepID=A0A3D9LJ55_MARFU|nr:phytoene desaturase family protein [Marinoscillum furvescens]REE05905.1 phytoene desaturase [Marinoscillum furvescens DSM 4134]
MSKNICVIGSGFAGLSAACHLAKAGNKVFVIEKNNTPGGRARQLELSGFTFDMGPSWYWMPDVFERFFTQFDKKPSDYYELLRLDPSYRVKFKDEIIDLPASMPELEALFESIETGSAQQLRRFLKQAEYKYQVGINDLVYKPSRSLGEFMDLRLLKGLVKMDVLTSMSSHIRKFFKSEKLIELMEFPVLFLGSTPQNTPALYSLMNYADMSLGTWYPMGGMHKVVEAMVALAQELGVTFHFGESVTEFAYKQNSISEVITDKTSRKADVVVAGADYHHVDQKLLPEQFRMYSPQYWDKRTMAPSSLLFYIGVNKRLPNMKHHVLFFDEDFKQHAHEIYTNPQWPTKPLLYTSATSLTDPSVAPAGCENLVVLIPVAPDLQDTPETRERYFNMIMDRLEAYTGTSIREHIVCKRSYAHNDFIGDYHSYKGNAYGLANTLQQTAILKPSIKNKKLKNLYFTGQLTVPGPGVPPSIISGEVVATEIAKDF